jgi:hypothetical protein
LEILKQIQSGTAHCDLTKISQSAPKYRAKSLYEALKIRFPHVRGNRDGETVSE